MNAFISYSLLSSDEYLLTLISFNLNEANIDVLVSQNDSRESVDEKTQQQISESDVFIGIVLNQGNEVKRVESEFDEANKMGIPCLFIIEDEINNYIISKSSVSLQRNNIQKTVYDIEREINLSKTDPKNKESLGWLVAGNSIIKTLNTAFQTIQNSAKYVSTGRLKLIEQQLKNIDSASFQNLCDIYLNLREKEFASINRTGSQIGKQKTIKGTPDTFFRVTNGKLIFVEYTTRKKGLVSKIKEDIDKCVDEKNTGISSNEIEKIVICFNSRITVSEEVDITKYAQSKGVIIELIGIDWLALEIYSKYLILAKDILGIPLDTGQLLPLKNFVDEYNYRAGRLATPLDNIFLHRESELKEIKQTLCNRDLLIISGAPGVGKTKIALEAIDEFISNNHDYHSFAIAKKDQDISQDLKIHLQQDRNYVLLIDDANRQLINFKQILGIFSEVRKGKIKIILTVRDYALNDIINECFNYDPYTIIIKRFSDTEITGLISSESFKIINPKYQKRIIELADGNARLAIMSSRIALQKQESFLIGDVSELYDSYFQTFIKDFDIFGDKTILKVLGIISFFFTIERDNKVFIQDVLTSFDLNYHTFNEAIDVLEKKELIEVQYNHARVSEQVMATYFFYKVFIKDNILSFKTLLSNFFPKWKRRFSDTVIPSNNSFGYENVLNKIDRSLNDYLQSIYSNDEKITDFLSLFWFYKREESLSYYNDKIKAIPEHEYPIYNAAHKESETLWDINDILPFLANFYNFYTESFIPSIELSFEYCRKKSELFPYLIKLVKERLLFDDEDFRYDCIRQVEFFNLIYRKINDNNPIYKEAFFALSATFLQHVYQVFNGGRKHTVTISRYTLPFNNTIKLFRKNIWVKLFEEYEYDQERVIAILSNYNVGFDGAVPEILEFDLSYLIPFIENNLNVSNIEHVHFVNEFVRILDRENLKNRDYKKLLTQFENDEYNIYERLDWTTYMGQQSYDFEYEEFQKLKEQELRSSFIFTEEKEFIDLLSAVKKSLLLKENHSWNIQQSLNIILEENFIKNEELGFKFLQILLKDYPNTLNPLPRIIKVISETSDEWTKKLWQLLNKWEHQNSIYWQITFFEFISADKVNEYYCSELINTIKSIQGWCYIRFETLEKFIEIDKDIFVKILKIIVAKNELKDIRIQTSFDFFEKYSYKLSDHYELLQKAYLQQVNNNVNFDYSNSQLKVLVDIDPEFILEYIKLFYAGTIRSKNANSKLAFIWDLQNSDKYVEQAADIILDSHRYYGIGTHPLNILFQGINDNQKIKAQEFILNYIQRFHSDTNKMNAIFDVLRHAMKDFFEQAFLHYLKYNTNEDLFKKIWWRGNGGSYVGDVIIGELEAKDWNRILEMINKSPNQLDLIEIRTNVKREIERALNSADYDRKMKFLDPDY